MRTSRLRLWLIRRLMPRGYQLARRIVMGVPPQTVASVGRPSARDLGAQIVDEHAESLRRLADE